MLLLRRRLSGRRLSEPPIVLTAQLLVVMPTVWAGGLARGQSIGHLPQPHERAT